MNCVRATNYFEKEKPLSSLYINSCGYSTDIDSPTGSRRPNGRKDYQLIGVFGGAMYVNNGEAVVNARKGSMILFKPDEPQNYGTNGNAEDAYYWIHFAGKEAEELLKICSVFNGSIFDIGCSEAELDFISEMISEINQKPECYQLRLKSIFIRLLTTLARKNAIDLHKKYLKIKPAIAAMESSDDKCRTVKEYAELCFMSEYYFIHTFKEATGKTPMRYKNLVVMESVKTLLRNTELSLNEIASRLGFCDSLYLSKKFKSAFGCTPSEYRNYKN